MTMLVRRFCSEPSRFFDGPLPVGRKPVAVAIADQPSDLRIVSRYLADATELRYRDCYDDQRIERLYRQMMRTVCRLVRSRGVERLEF